MKPLSRCLAVCLLLLLSVLLGCSTPKPAPQSYVVLLQSPDGTTGKVIIKGNKGEQLIDKANYGVPLDGSAVAAPVDEDKLKQDFGAAMGARAQLPVHFLLYFESGGAQLTPDSQAELAQIIATVGARSFVDMSIIGHSDTVGNEALNDALSLRRAQVVAELLKGKGLHVDALTIESHGKRNLLVPTPDQTAEPRNRRVEISIR